MLFPILFLSTSAAGDFVGFFLTVRERTAFAVLSVGSLLPTAVRTSGLTPFVPSTLLAPLLPFMALALLVPLVALAPFGPLVVTIRGGTLLLVRVTVRDVCFGDGGNDEV